MTSNVKVELDVRTREDKVDMEADNTSTITTAIMIDGNAESMVGTIVSNRGFPVASFITTLSP